MKKVSLEQQMLNAYINEEEKLKSLRRNKASGVDNLPPGLLKDSTKEIAVPLTLSISTSTFPTNWKVARVTPIYKSGCANDEANYRSISVLPILSRILEKAVYNQLKEYLEENNLLSQQQFGYRSRRSTETAAILFLADIRKNTEKGKLVRAVFMDLSRAFDTISHATLTTKLKAYGISG